MIYSIVKAKIPVDGQDQQFDVVILDKLTLPTLFPYDTKKRDGTIGMEKTIIPIVATHYYVAMCTVKEDAQKEGKYLVGVDFTKTALITITDIIGHVFPTMFHTPDVIEFVDIEDLEDEA